MSRSTSSPVPFKTQTRSAARAIVVQKRSIVTGSTDIGGGVTKRFTMDIPLSKRKTAKMANNQALIEALHQFMMAVAEDRQERKGCHRELAKGNERGSSSRATRSGPSSSSSSSGGGVTKTDSRGSRNAQGAPTDYAQGFLHHINRLGGIEEWTNAQRLQVAVRRLVGTAQH